MAEQEEPQLWQTAAPVEFVPHIDERTEAQALLISTRQARDMRCRWSIGPCPDVSSNPSVDGLFPKCVRDAVPD